jgi:hypothetical protein
MSFDPCGTRRLEGEDLLQRLAEALHMDKEALKMRLTGIEPVSQPSQGRILSVELQAQNGSIANGLH